jgi:ribosomal protein S18 acetylase RimI-like enzyme
MTAESVTNTDELRNYGREMARFKAKNSDQEVVLRYPRWEDLKPFHRYLNQVHEESFEEPMWFSTHPIDLPSTSRKLAEILKKIEVKGDPFLFVEIDGNIVGQGWVWIGGPNFGADIGLLGLELTRATRGMGIGTKLFDLLEAEAKNNGAKMIELTMASANRACQLYERLGYQEVGRVPHSVMSNYGKEKWEDRADLVYMIKYL